MLVNVPSNYNPVSTHSRPKAAGYPCRVGGLIAKMFQHTAARRRLVLHQHQLFKRRTVSTHSRPKAAGAFVEVLEPFGAVSTHSRPKAAGRGQELLAKIGEVSTHSRPKAAGTTNLWHSTRPPSFNTQPPEGGWGSNTARDVP